MTSLSRETLIANGFAPFKSNCKQYTDQGYQKRVIDDRGTRYFITIWEYDNRKYNYLVPNNRDFSYSPEVNLRNDDVWFDVTMLSPESIEQMESFFDDVWTKMQCGYYED